MWDKVRWSNSHAFHAFNFRPYRYSEEASVFCFVFIEPKYSFLRWMKTTRRNILTFLGSRNLVSKVNPVLFDWMGFQGNQVNFSFFRCSNSRFSHSHIIFSQPSIHHSRWSCSVSFLHVAFPLESHVGSWLVHKITLIRP